MNKINYGDIQNLIMRAHTIALVKGWWGEDGNHDRDYNEIDALIHSELAEATEAFREGKMEMYFLQGGKPEGFVVELADAVIRAADYLGRHSSKYEDDCDCIEATYNILNSELFFSPLQIINKLHMLIAKSSEYGYSKNDTMRRRTVFMFIYSCYEAANILNINIHKAIDAKLDYNATRPFRHGGKLA